MDLKSIFQKLKNAWFKKNEQRMLSAPDEQQWTKKKEVVKHYLGENYLNAEPNIHTVKSNDTAINKSAVNQPIIDQDKENKILATIYAEAIGEGEKGLQAVINNIVNRRKKGSWGKTDFDVISSPKQYSAFSTTNKLYTTARDYLRGGENIKIDSGIKQALDTIKSLYDKAKKDELEDITKGNLYYLNPKTATDNKYFQKRDKSKDVVIGNHVFWDF